jgi:hypothetical protein
MHTKGTAVSEHIQGPWHYQEESDAYTHIVRGPSGEHIVQLPQDTSGKAEARARLFAAAPEMLATLKSMRSTLLRLGGDPMPTLDAVIAKAEAH